MYISQQIILHRDYNKDLSV